MLILKARAVAISLVLSLCGLLALPASGMAATTAQQAVAQGYSSDTPLQPGMIVRLDNRDSSKVVPLGYNDVNKMLGVVVSGNDAAITLGNNSSHNQVFVTNYGRHQVLVSNQNGPISVGDYITISNLSGIGMKADGNEAVVLGQAAANFNGVTGVIGSTTLTSSNGQKSSVNIGEVAVDISVANNPLAQGPKGLPSFLKKITRFATNKSVSATRVYISLFILLAGIFLTITIIYSGIRTGIISLGRNPLAKKTISGSLVRVIFFGVIIFAISLGAAYAVLL